jgi:hypothetical protein
MRYLLILLTVILCPYRDSVANFTVYVGDGDPNTNKFNVSAGTGTLPVFAYNSDLNNPISITSYSLAFFVAAGNPNFSNFTGIFSGGIFGVQDVVSSITPGLSLDTSFLAESTKNTGPAVTLPTSQAAALKLFDLTFSFPQTTTAGTYAFTFVPEFGLNYLSSSNQQVNSSFAIFSGTNLNEFEIEGNPVPEPTSLLLVACAGGVAAYKLRRRRRLQARAAHSSPMIVG